MINRFLDPYDAGNTNVLGDLGSLATYLNEGRLTFIGPEDLSEVALRSSWRVTEEEDSGKIVGMVALSPNHAPRGFFGLIADMVVRPEYRRKGIAGKLLDDIVKEAKRQRMRWLCAMINPDQEAAKLFLKKGFVPDANGGLRLDISSP